MTPQPTRSPSPARWLSVTVLAVGLAAGIAIGALLPPGDGDSPAVGGPPREGWNAYTNREHGYQIEYPPAWELRERATRCDETFCVQDIELKRGDAASIFVFVNFQGGWCEGSPRKTVEDIVVSGHGGKEYRCSDFTIRSFGPGDSVIRYFPGAKGKINYLILGQARSDLSEVDAIVATFRFID